ncbi:MAG: hypothetical protein JW718_07625 [Desulfovibrionaceae bacterium]|nr:hypothetical protein [Desulfovibrionaceae bacterium]
MIIQRRLEDALGHVEALMGEAYLPSGYMAELAMARIRLRHLLQREAERAGRLARLVSSSGRRCERGAYQD